MDKEVLFLLGVRNNASIAQHIRGVCCLTVESQWGSQSMENIVGNYLDTDLDVFTVRPVVVWSGPI